jgi:DNA (cytosine-5)-methyltransferase 1
VSRPLLLDLFSGAGGAAVGYHRAGFDVIGVDVDPQPHYPFRFIQHDAIGFLRGRYKAYMGLPDAIHASPPCQHYSAMSSCRPGLADKYPELITPTRQLLEQTGLPWVIENVPRAKRWMRDPITLCGRDFGLDLYRHRLFESNTFLMQPPHQPHTVPASKAGHWRPGTIMSVSGHVAPIAEARRAMGGIDWMTRDELAESVPPDFTEYIGAQLLDAVRAAA